MKIEEGKYYRQRNGQIVGPMALRDPPRQPFPFICRRTLGVFAEDGSYTKWGKPHGCDLVEKFYTPEPPCGGKTGSERSPVRTVTRKEIVPGTYGPDARLNIEARDGDQSETYIDLIDGWYKAAEIREFARLLNEIADAMEDGE